MGKLFANALILGGVPAILFLSFLYWPAFTVGVALSSFCWLVLFLWYVGGQPPDQDTSGDQRPRLGKTENESQVG